MGQPVHNEYANYARGRPKDKTMGFLPFLINRNMIGNQGFIDQISNIEEESKGFKAGLQQAGVDLQAAEQQAAEVQSTEQQGIEQLNNIPPQIAQMLGAPNPEQQAQQQLLQDQEKSRQREAQDRASFGKDQEFENVMKALGSVNGLMQNR